MSVRDSIWYIESKIARWIADEIVKKFPIYWKRIKEDTQYEMSVFVYSEEEIKKILSLLSGITLNNWNAIREILTRSIENL